MESPRYDILYTWVDDRFPGFQEERARYAKNAHDLNPQRTRDNLDLLKYSLRSVERYAPWRGKIFIVTCRPQVPRWLNAGHPDIRLVYLDSFMPAGELPSFNAFAIESYIHTISSLSQRYVHFNDDMLLCAEVRASDLVTPDGRLKYYFPRPLPKGRTRRDSRTSPHQSGLINVARTLENSFGPGTYPQLAHHPRIIDKSDMARLVEKYPEEFARTRAQRFRAQDTTLPHTLLAPFLVQEGCAEYNGKERSNPLMRMVKLRNSALMNRFGLARAMARRPRFLALNDDFGTEVNKKAEAVVRQFLDRLLPHPSSFEK